MKVLALARAGLAVAALLLAGAASADPYPGRRGTSGVLDVPDAEVVGRGGGLIGGELRLDLQSGKPADAGPMPVSVVTGLSSRVETGFWLREWGYPGDPRPSPLLFGAAMKLQLVEPDVATPGLALVLTADRFNWRGDAGAQLAVSTRQLGPLRLAASAGVEAHGPRPYALAFTGGVAATLQLAKNLDTAWEAVRTADGPIVSAALRYRLLSRAGVSLGVSWLPDESGVRVSLGFGLLAASPRPKRTRVIVVEQQPEAAPEPQEAVATGPQFTDPVPRFRLKLRTARLQHAPYELPTAAAKVPAAAAPKVPPAAATKAPAPAPAAIDPAEARLRAAEAKLRDAEAAVSEHRRRLSATQDQLRARDAAAATETARLSALLQAQSDRDQRLDARERTLRREAPTPQDRQLESREAQLAATERQLSAQERTFQATIDAALGRERDAGARESSERQEAEHAAATALGVSDRARAVELRQQGVAARQRELAATELRLAAWTERLDAEEARLRARGERLDAVRRRLDARAERLDAMEQRLAARNAPADASVSTTHAAVAKDRAVFVMIVKTPTAALKEAASTDAAVSGPSAEKAVAAATMVAFPTPDSQLSELDWESVDRVAAQAAREGCELLIWARAKSPSLLGEASRRASEIKSRLIGHAQLSERQVVTRITTRPGAGGVEVVISALRDPTLTPGGPVPPIVTDYTQRRGASAETLQGGETGRRQLREAIRAVQPSIEICLGEHVVRQGLSRAEGVVKVTVSPEGRVTRLSTTAGDLGGPELQECLAKVAAAWMLPPASSEYVVEIPITVVIGGAKR